MITLEDGSGFEKHVWVVRLKHVFLITFSYFAFIFLLAIPESTEDFRQLLQINFTPMNYSGFLISKPIIYILFEEFAFRSSLKDSKLVLIMASTLLLILCIYQFSNADLSFYLFSVYGLYLLVHLNNYRGSTSSIIINYILGLFGLCSFHLLKFDISISSMNELNVNYLIPIVVLGTLLFLIRQRHTSLVSILTYLIIYLISDGL